MDPNNFRSACNAIPVLDCVCVYEYGYGYVDVWTKAVLFSVFMAVCIYPCFRLYLHIQVQMSLLSTLYLPISLCLFTLFTLDYCIPAKSPNARPTTVAPIDWYPLRSFGVGRVF